MKRFLLALVLGASTVLSAQTSEGFTSGPVFAGCDTTAGSKAAISCMPKRPLGKPCPAGNGKTCPSQH